MMQEKDVTPIVKKSEETQAMTQEKEIAPVVKKSEETQALTQEKEIAPVVKNSEETQALTQEKEIAPAVKKSEETQALTQEKDITTIVEKSEETQAMTQKKEINSVVIEEEFLMQSMAEVYSLPMVKEALEAVNSIYGKVKKSNCLCHFCLKRVESTLHGVMGMTRPVAKCILSSPIGKVDDLLLKGLTFVEETVPAVTLPSEEVIEKAKHYIEEATEPCKNKIKRVLGAALLSLLPDSVKIITNEATNDEGAVFETSASKTDDGDSTTESSEEENKTSNKDVAESLAEKSEAELSKPGKAEKEIETIYIIPKED